MNDIALAQQKMYLILKEIQRICDKHDIKYWIDAGTLLGAVRHKGFIPWDDDIDICMLRSDYNKFISLAKNELDKDFFLQTSETDVNYPKRTIPCKIRMNNTEIIESEDIFYGINNFSFHKGLFVDVFPMDYYSSNIHFRKFQRLFSYVYYMKTSSVFSNHKNKLRKYISNIFKYIPWYFVEKVKLKLINNQNNKYNKVIGYGIEIPNCNYYHRVDDIFPLSNLFFYGDNEPVPNEYNKYLFELYGSDFMSLPPVSQRKIHAESIVIND